MKQPEFECKQCSVFLAVKELENGKCPVCKNDDDLVMVDWDEFNNEVDEL